MCRQKKLSQGSIPKKKIFFAHTGKFLVKTDESLENIYSIDNETVERASERAARVPILMCAVHEEKSSVERNVQNKIRSSRN